MALIIQDKEINNFDEIYDFEDNMSDISIDSIDEELNEYTGIKDTIREFKLMIDKNIKCSICQDIIRKYQTISYPCCGHLFHQLCLDGWLKKSCSCSCPNCKRHFFEEPKIPNRFTKFIRKNRIEHIKENMCFRKPVLSFRNKLQFRIPKINKLFFLV
jgi:hypothetical protein